jgi:signal transduction histidine kinase
MPENTPRVLLVDDRIDKLLAMEAALQPLAVDIVTARSGAEAIPLTDRLDFAVILLDVRMPGLDGFETAARIRQQGRSVRTPIIFVSAAETPELIEQGYALGAVDYLQNLVPQILLSKVSVFVDLFTQRMEISQGKQVEETLRQAKQEAEAANAAKDRFLAALSHELRTPLTPVIALLPALLENKDFPEEMRADLQMIQRNVQLEAHLINDLLDLTGIAKGRLHLNLQRVDAHDLTHHALTIVEESAKARKINLHVSLKAEHPQIWGDSVRLQQVLWNILENAIKFTPEEGDVWISSSNPDPGNFQLKCVDSGKGIKAEELDRIFHAFEQVAAPGGYRFGGLGLGLFISKAVLERHGGSINAISDGSNEGATFVIELPVLAPTEPSADAAPLRDILVVRPLRILLVEDHVNTREVMTRLLTKRGHTVRAAECLQAAFELVATNQFDLIISDLGLPDGSGLDLMPELKSRYGLKGIAVSGYGMEEDLNKSRLAGFSAHLVKPVDFRQLEAALLKVLAEENEKRV